MRRLAAALVLSGVPGGAWAQNVVSNGEFATNVAGWTISGTGTFLWDPLDWQAGAGSGVLRNTSFPFDTVVTASQCVAFAPAGPIDFGAHVRVPSAQTNAGTVDVSIRFFADATCTPPVIGGDSVILSGTPLDTWALLFKANVGVAAGTQSVQVRLNVAKELMGTSYRAHFDRVVLGHAGTTPVELQAFAVE